MQLFLPLFLIHKSDKWTPIGAEFQTGKCHIRLRPLGTARVHVSVCFRSKQDAETGKQEVSLVGAPESTRAWQSTVCCCCYCPLSLKESSRFYLLNFAI